MKYKILGKSGLEVSKLALGALQFARVKEKDAIRLVHSTYDSGVNLIDTTHVYLNSKYLLVKAIIGIRKNIYIITKPNNKVL